MLIILIFYNFFSNFNNHFVLWNQNFDTFPISLLLKYFFRQLKFLNIFFSYLILSERSINIQKQHNFNIIYYCFDKFH